MTLQPFTGDQLRVSEAQDRYNIGKTALNGRIRHCGISPTRSGHATFLSQSDVQILDNLHQHLSEGKGMNTFLSPIGEIVQEEESTEQSAIVRRNNTVSVSLPTIPTGLSEISRMEQLTKTLEFLDRCVEKGWLLPTSEIRHILGTAPRKTGWSRYGFVFEIAGTHGQETAWAVLGPLVEAES